MVSLTLVYCVVWRHVLTLYYMYYFSQSQHDTAHGITAWGTQLVHWGAIQTNSDTTHLTHMETRNRCTV